MFRKEARSRDGNLIAPLRRRQRKYVTTTSRRAGRQPFIEAKGNGLERSLGLVQRECISKANTTRGVLPFDAWLAMNLQRLQVVSYSEASFALDSEGYEET